MYYYKIVNHRIHDEFDANICWIIWTWHQRRMCYWVNSQLFVSISIYHGHNDPTLKKGQCHWECWYSPQWSLQVVSSWALVRGFHGCAGCHSNTQWVSGRGRLWGEDCWSTGRAGRWAVVEWWATGLTVWASTRQNTFLVLTKHNCSWFYTV